MEQNPPTGDILRNHELAHRTITQHNTPLAIFDQSELNILRGFVVDTSEDNRAQVLKNASRGNMYDGPDVAEEDAGKMALEHGSLAGYVVARYGKVDHGTINQDEVGALRQWFADGGGKE